MSNKCFDCILYVQAVLMEDHQRSSPINLRGKPVI